MKVLGIVLIFIGGLMLIINGINFKTEKKVADIGPIKISKEEDKHVGWPVYTGAVIAIAGLGLVIGARKK